MTPCSVLDTLQHIQCLELMTFCQIGSSPAESRKPCSHPDSIHLAAQAGGQSALEQAEAAAQAVAEAEEAAALATRLMDVANRYEEEAQLAGGEASDHLLSATVHALCPQVRVTRILPAHYNAGVWDVAILQLLGPAISQSVYGHLIPHCDYATPTAAPLPTDAFPACSESAHDSPQYVKLLPEAAC